MTEERKQYIQITLAYNCIILAFALGAFAFSMWLVISGRLFQEGVDGVFLFAVGLVLGSGFSTVPALSLRQGLLSDVCELWREGTKQAVTRLDQVSSSVRVQSFQPY